jgi:hypothetical protein
MRVRRQVPGWSGALARQCARQRLIWWRVEGVLELGKRKLVAQFYPIGIGWVAFPFRTRLRLFLRLRRRVIARKIEAGL